MTGAPPDLMTLGNTCCDLFVPDHSRPPPGGIVTIDSLEVVPGGNGANTAITAGRLGIRVALIGVLGDDLFGRYLREHLGKAGVDTSLLQLLPGRTSPATIVFNDAATGERSFVHHPGTNLDFSVPADARRLTPRILHLAAPELLPGLWPGGAVALAREMRARGAIVTLDTFAVVDPSQPGSAERVEREHRELLGTVDMVFPNELESGLVTGRKDLEAQAARFHELGVRVVAIKRGERGAHVSWEGRAVDLPTGRVAAVDTCGAGDNFSAGFLAGTLWGLSPEEAGRLGCALGSLCVEHRGSTTGSEDPGRLERVLASLGLRGRAFGMDGSPRGPHD